MFIREIPTPPITSLLPHTINGVAPLPEHPSVIIGSSSGGNDSNAAILYARWRWPDVPIIIWHALIDEMDWEETPTALDALAQRVGGRRITVQVIYQPVEKQHRQATLVLRSLHCMMSIPMARQQQNSILTVFARCSILRYRPAMGSHQRAVFAGVRAFLKLLPSISGYAATARYSAHIPS